MSKDIKEQGSSDKNKTKSPAIKNYPRSYKLEPHIMEALNLTLTRANKISPNKISEARLVKALIFMSKGLTDKQLETVLKEIW